MWYAHVSQCIYTYVIYKRVSELLVYLQHFFRRGFARQPWRCPGSHRASTLPHQRSSDTQTLDFIIKDKFAHIVGTRNTPSCFGWFCVLAGSTCRRRHPRSASAKRTFCGCQRACTISCTTDNNRLMPCQTRLNAPEVDSAWISRTSSVFRSLLTSYVLSESHALEMRLL